ncbi:MAG: Gldg family protein [Owenweeksia sp.]|nr:Gldg family protein [Owenweeksia sp.]
MFEQLQFKGLKYYELQVNEAGSKSSQRVFPGAIINYGEKEVAVNLLIDQLGVSPERQINASVQNLEYALANAIRGLVRQSKPSIAFVEGHGELEPKYILDFAKTLNQNYQVDRFNLRQYKSDSNGQNISITDQQRRLNQFDALIIARPKKAFSNLDKYLLDQYVMTGGKVLWLIDAVQANMDSLSERPQFISFPIYDRLNIADMLFRYGARINTNLVTDRVSAGVSDTRKTYPCMYFPMVMPQVEHPITKDINAVKLEFPSSIDTIISPGIKKTILPAQLALCQSLGYATYCKTSEAI